MALYSFIGRNDEAVFIADPLTPGQITVTNAAEFVAREVASCWGAERRIIYRDSDGRWDEIKHNGGRFTGFAALSERDHSRWREWLIPLGEEAI